MPVTKEQLKMLRQIKESLVRERDTKKAADWELIQKYVLRDLDKRSIEHKKRFYSTTAQRYTSLAANALQGWAYGRTISWLNVEPESSDIKNNLSSESREWFQKCVRIMLEDLAKSDFYDESLAFTKIVLNLSTGILLLDWDEKKELFVVENISPTRCCISQDKYHHVNLLMYEFELNKHQAMQMFEDDCPAKISRSKDEGTKYTFTRAIVSSSDYDIDVPGEDEWIDLTWCDEDKETVTSERRVSHKPFACWRFERSLDGSPWGVDSPGEICLANIESLGLVEKSMLKSVQLRSDPPVKASEGLKLNIVPAGVTRLTGNKDYQFTPPPGSVEEPTLMIQRWEQALKEAYYVDFFLMLQQTLEKNKTATEATLLADEKSQIMASFSSRLNNEFLEPVLETLWDLEIKHGRFPAPPEELVGSEIKIDYVSPLTIAQRKAQIYVPARQFMADTLSFAQIDPSVKYIFKIPEYVEEMAHDLMINEKFINSKEDVNRKVQEEQMLAMEQLNNENQREDLKTTADAVAKLGGNANGGY